MTTLQEIIPQVSTPHVPDLRPLPFTPPSAARYAPFTAPARQHVPYWILHDPTLANSMMERLRAYLETAPGGHLPPSPRFQHLLDYFGDDLLNTPYGKLSSEETTSELWNKYILELIRYAVKDIDQNPTLPGKPLTTPTLYSETRDFLISSTPETSPRLYYDIKSWSVFDAFALDILSLAQHVEDGQLGTPLELRVNEENARAVIMKMGVSMISEENMIPYGILFGGHRFMLFSLFSSTNALGEVRYGLACSDIIGCTDKATPLIPMVISTLLGSADGPAPLCLPTFATPPVPIPAVQGHEPVRKSSCGKFISSILPKKVIIHTSAAGGAMPRTFVLRQEPDTPSEWRVIQKFRDLFTFVPSNEVEISLSECIRHGAAGQVFIGITENEKYAVKVAPWKAERRMLQREADIYKILLDLQGRCIPKVFGLFGSEHLKASIMEYMGPTVENVLDLSLDQRHQLLEELCLIHERGIVHDDLRAPNIVLKNGSPHFIDFSHAREHQCTGFTKCSELIMACQLFSLNAELEKPS